MSERRGDCACLLGRTTVRVCANAGMPDKQNKIKTAMFNKFLRYGTTPAEIFRSCICMRLRSKTIFRRGVISRCFQKPRRHRRLAFRHKERPSANRANVVAPVWSTRAGTFDRRHVGTRSQRPLPAYCCSGGVSRCGRITLVRYSPPCITAAERKRGSAQPQEKEGNRLKTGDGGNEESLAELLVLADEVQNSMVENFRLLPVGRMSAVLKYDSLCCRYPGRDHPHQRRRQGGVGIRGR